MTPQTPTPPAEGTVAGSRRPVLITYFAPRDLAHILDHVDATGFGPDTAVCIGSYGPNPTASTLIRERGYLYAPLYSVQPGRDDPAHGHHVSGFYLQRSPAAFTDEERQQLDQAHEGPIPLLIDGRPLPSHDELAWGQELGRRFRDNLRLSRQHMAIDAWQFDELVSQIWFDVHQRSSYLDFMTGILNGLHVGRPECGDKPEPGLVWCAGELLQALPRMSLKTPGLGRLYTELNRTASYLVGEEYPLFTGEPAALASHWTSPLACLRRAPVSTARYKLSQRYIAAFTPGIDQAISTAQHLNGRVSGQSVQQALAWKSQFLQHRLTTPPKGVGEYCFLGHNCDGEILKPVLEGLKAARDRCA